ncbi:MAG TPA: 30S ribosome-binding factor RbfA [Planctomycetota bacterium]|nr:30S ribosome-binding factor RbfA [Planctomycetota bacterium]
MPSRHLLRVASRLKFLVGTIIQNELHDPRVGFVTVLKVEPSVDFKEARVHVSVLGTRGEQSRTLHALEDARGYIQRRLGENLRLRNTPTLRFVLDTELEKLARVERLIDEARDEFEGDEAERNEDPGDEASVDAEEADAEEDEAEPPSDRDGEEEE